MPIATLDHVNLRTARLATSRARGIVIPRMSVTHAAPTTIGTSAGMVFTIVWPKARAIA